MSTPRMTEKSVHACSLAGAHFDFCTIQDLGNTNLGNDATHGVLDLPTSTKMSSWMILHWVKLTKHHHADEVELYRNFWNY